MFFLRRILCEQTCIYHCGSAVSSIRSQLPVGVLMRPSSQLFSLDASELKRLSFVSTVCPSSVQSVLHPTVWPLSRWLADFCFIPAALPSVAPPSPSRCRRRPRHRPFAPLLYSSPYCYPILPKPPAVFNTLLGSLFFHSRTVFDTATTCRPAVALLPPPNPCDHLQKSRRHSLKFFSNWPLLF
jgi:hypothetical protein